MSLKNQRQNIKIASFAFPTKLHTDLMTKKQPLVS